MGHKQDEDLGFGENRAMNNLAKAIREHTEALLKLSCQTQTQNATKQDLLESTAQIIKAFGERVNSTTVQELKQSTGELKAAVAANQPIAGA